MSVQYCSDCTTAYSIGAPSCPHCASTKQQEEPVGGHICRGCGTGYAVRLYTCPRCKGTDFEEDESMPKITRLGGASDASADSAPSDTPPVVVDDPPAADDSTAETDELTESGPVGEMEGVEVSADGTWSPELTGDPDAEGEALAETEPVDYSAWKVDQLREELASRSLATDGLKGDLVERLTQADADKASEQP